MKKIIFLISLAIIISAGCAKNTSDNTRQEKGTADQIIDATTGIGAVEKTAEAVSEVAKVNCIQLCKNYLINDTELSNGPCIGNPMAQTLDWVCDVAHNPRQAVDNKQENQCSAFREGKAKHFIEVDENCGFIKSF